MAQPMPLVMAVALKSASQLSYEPNDWFIFSANCEVVSRAVGVCDSAVK